MRYGSPNASPRNSAITILGGVPISVIMPPRIDAKDSGISVNDGLLPAFLAACISTGMSKASAATLFIIAESAAARPDMMVICVPSLRDASTTWRATISIAPELESPRLTTRTKAMMTVAGCPKPEKAFAVGTSPVRIATSSATKATRS